MKKVFAAIMVAVLALTLGACTANPTPPSETDAQKAYEDFWGGKANATVDGENTLSVKDLGSDNVRYALYDISGDDIPELIVTGKALFVFTYQNDGVVLAYTEDTANATVSVLSTKAILTTAETDGITYRYTTFTTDCRPSTLTFTRPTGGDENALYTFNGHESSKEEWESTATPLLSEQPAELTWETVE